jgi:hypothetical protein
MKERKEEFKKACAKAVDYQISFQRPDGGYIWDGYPIDAFHKQALSWQLGGHHVEALKLLNWVAEAKKLRADGQLEQYRGDNYKHAWFFQGAHLLGRFDISYPVMSYLRSQVTECGGLPHFDGDELVRALSTAWTGVGALYFGDLELAIKIANCCISMLKQQPREDRFYFQMTRDGRLVTETVNPDAQFIDTTQPRQCYWEVGFAMLLMCKMYEATKDKSYLDHAKSFLEFKLRCFKDNFSFWGSGKSALAAANYYKLTGDKRAKEAALQFCRFVADTQTKEGGFRYEDEPDELIIYVDHAACFSVWAGESLKIFESLES